METIKEVVEKALNEKRITKTEFCESLGIGRTYFYKFFDNQRFTWQQSRLIEELTGKTMEELTKER